MLELAFVEWAAYEGNCCSAISLT